MVLLTTRDGASIRRYQKPSPRNRSNSYTGSDRRKNTLKILNNVCLCELHVIRSENLTEIRTQVDFLATLFIGHYVDGDK